MRFGRTSERKEGYRMQNEFAKKDDFFLTKKESYI